MKFSLIGGVLALALPLASFSATVTSGTFNLAGAVNVTTTQLQFGYATTPPPGDQTAGVILPDTGAFSGLTAGQTATIGNLTLASDPVGTPFNLPNWIVLPDNINLNLTFIDANSSIPVCNGVSDNAVGNECRAIAGSPVVLTQGADGVTAVMNILGNAHFVGDATLTPARGKLSANFTAGQDVTIDGLLNDFATNGHITTGYALNVSTNPVPEPGYLAMAGLGLLGLGAWRKRNMVR